MQLNEGLQITWQLQSTCHQGTYPHQTSHIALKSDTLWQQPQMDTRRNWRQVHKTSALRRDKGVKLFTWHCIYFVGHSLPTQKPFYGLRFSVGRHCWARCISWFIQGFLRLGIHAYSVMNGVWNNISFCRKQTYFTLSGSRFHNSIWDIILGLMLEH